MLLCKTGPQQACVTAITPMEICFSYRCAVSQQKCTAALGKAKCIRHCSVLLCKTGSQQALCHFNYTYGDLLFIQVCSEPTEMHCSTGLGKVHSPLCSAAVQNWLTAALRHCKHTCGDLLFIQVCSDAKPKPCSSGQGRSASLLSSAAL